ncbi:MAG: alpha/beta hydrolase [Acidobacteriia bacterium]|nr:alpha/beta hydrolase [Terriglobia bacterium]
MRTALAILILTPALWSQAPPPGRLVDLGGRSLHLNCTGQGEPAVIVTGAGYSFDWSLVQPEVAKFTRICTYDPAGFAWSDPGPGPECPDRAADLRKLLSAAEIKGPYVLAGLSYGALVARYYAAQHPDDVAAVVMVDHAFLDPGHEPAPPAPGAPVLISQTPIALTLEDISNFGNLPRAVRELHRWADSLGPPMPSVDTARACAALVEGKTLGAKPLVVVSTRNDSPNYAPLQAKLLALSTNHRQIIAEKSFHAVEIDEPDVVVRAIRLAVESLR